MSGEAGIVAPSVALIAAVAENGVLGKDGGLPWRLPADLKRFKALTMGHHLILGRRTWETLDGPLPGRIPVVVTRRPGLPAEVLARATVGEALAIAAAAGDRLPFVGGGAEIFRVALAEDRIDRIYLTRIHQAFAGDTYFPAYDEARFRLAAREDHTVDEGHPYPFSFLTLERRSGRSEGAEVRESDRRSSIEIVFLPPRLFAGRRSVTSGASQYLPLLSRLEELSAWL